MLVLHRSAAQQEALSQFLADLQNPRSPSYRKWLTPAQFGARFGISDADLQSVESWLQSHGFKIEMNSPARNIIEFSGNFNEVQNAFHTAIHTFLINGKTYFASTTDPQIPAALAPVVSGVGPLNSFRPSPAFLGGPRGHWETTTHSIQPDLTLNDTSGNSYLFVDPADAATIYDSPNANLNPNYSGATWNGTGVNIGIVGVSDLTTADVQNFREAFLGEISGSINMPVQVVDGNDPGLIPGAAADEALLDNEVAGGIAPSAKIYYYTSADTELSSGLLNATLRAIDDNAVSILSESYEACESDLGTTWNQLIFEAAEQAAAQGISFVVSAGDGGSAGCDDFGTQSQANLGFAVNGFASTPYTVAVGGTDFDTLKTSFSSYVNNGSPGTAPYYRTAQKYIPENPWNDSTTVNTTLANNVPYIDSKGNGNIIAGSGGISSIYAKPSWQNSLTPNDNARDLPDVSFLAADGFYHAMWVFCGDNISDGNSSSGYVACQTSGGQFTSSTVFEGAGGTSAATPAFAGMLALVSQSQGGARLGQPNPVLYGLAASKYASVFHDVTTGNNSVPCVAGSPNCGTNGFLTAYNAGTGYDMASGLGSIDVAQLIQNWTSVLLASTSTSLSLDGSTAAYSGIHGASITFDAGVTSSGTTPTGNIAIIDSTNESSGGTASGPQNDGQFVIPLTNGTGSATYNGLPGGSYTVEARYSGDAANAASTSSPISVTISPEPSTTTLQVNAYDPSTGAPIGLVNVPYGSEIIADAQIEGTAEGSKTQGLATGTVTFSDTIPTVGTAVVGNGNIASLPITSAKSVPPSAGSHTFTASYSGDASYAASNSAGISFTVTKAATSTTVTTYPGTLTAPQTFYLQVATTFLVSAEFGVADTFPTYAVSVNGTSLGTFRTGGDINATGPGVSGHPEFLTEISVDGQYLQQGQNVVTVTYTGGTNYTPSSASANVNYVGGVGSFTLTNGGNISVTAGLDGNSSLTLTPSGGFLGQVNLACFVSGAPTGISCSAPPIYITSTAAASTSLLLITNSFSPAGSYTINVTASDEGTGKITASTGLTLTLTAASPGLLLSESNNIIVNPGATTGNTSTIYVTSENGFTGAVDLSCSLISSPAGASDLPACSITSPVNIPTPTTATAMLSVRTTGPTSASLEHRLGGQLFAGGGSILALVIFFGFPIRRRGWCKLLTLVAVLIITSAMVACGGGGGSGGAGGANGGSGGQSVSGTTPGSYTFTVKAVDAATRQITASVSVVVTIT